MTVLPFRIGQGYDCHALVEGRPLIIGGVTIPHKTGLMGHSDADVLLHALTDALLGAAALGDIGTLFPPSEEAYRDADSVELLRQVAGILEEEGYRPGNVDITIICEKPSIAPHREAMRRKLAAALELPLAAVSVKATTTEGMGFVGRGEGIAAQAVASLYSVQDRGFYEEQQELPSKYSQDGLIIIQEDIEVKE